MMKAFWNNELIAESDQTTQVEGNYYFPKESVKEGILIESQTHSTCPWKGEASYYSIAVNGQENKDAAWYYASPKPAAAEIKGKIAFWKGITVQP